MKNKMRFWVAIAAATALFLPFPARAEDDFLYAEECFTASQGEEGPWLYESENLTLTVYRKTRNGQAYTVADIHTRNGESFFSGGAHGEYSPSRVEPPLKLARRYHAVLGFTGDFLLHHSNPKGVMIRDGVVYYDRSEQDTLAVMPDGTLKAYPAGTATADELTALGVRNAYGFGPILVMDGEAYAPALTHFLAHRNRRCSIGMVEARHYIVITTSGYFTNAVMQEIFLELGCTVAYHMDGGHSSTMVLMGEQLNAQSYNAEMDVFQRPLGDMVLLGTSELVPAMDDPVLYTNTILGGK